MRFFNNTDEISNFLHFIKNLETSNDKQKFTLKFAFEIETIDDILITVSKEENVSGETKLTLSKVEKVSNLGNKTEIKGIETFKHLFNHLMKIPDIEVLSYGMNLINQQNDVINREALFRDLCPCKELGIVLVKSCYRDMMSPTELAIADLNLFIKLTTRYIKYIETQASRKRALSSFSSINIFLKRRIPECTQIPLQFTELSIGSSNENTTIVKLPVSSKEDFKAKMQEIGFEVPIIEESVKVKYYGTPLTSTTEEDKEKKEQLELTGSINTNRFLNLLIPDLGLIDDKMDLYYNEVYNTIISLIFLKYHKDLKDVDFFTFGILQKSKGNPKIVQIVDTGNPIKPEEHYHNYDINIKGYSIDIMICGKEYYAINLYGRMFQFNLNRGKISKKHIFNLLNIPIKDSEDEFDFRTNNIEELAILKNLFNN